LSKASNFILASARDSFENGAPGPTVFSTTYKLYIHTELVGGNEMNQENLGNNKFRIPPSEVF
jgi:glutaredoxin-related protein